MRAPSARGGQNSIIHRTFFKGKFGRHGDTSSTITTVKHAAEDDMSIWWDCNRGDEHMFDERVVNYQSIRAAGS